MSGILVTGGAGFIGSALVRRLIADGDHVINIDSLTYAGNLDSLADARDHPHHHFVHADITDAEMLAHVFATHTPRAVIHLAAESHVDRSIETPDAFVQTNVVGTFRLLHAAHRHYLTLSGTARDAFRFVHVSTDEVFGSLSASEPPFSTKTPYAPRSPYSASKAAADHMARAWTHTYGLPVIVTNCSNNYGPYQFPEKLIPLTILRALRGEALPVYGAGNHVRDWIYVDDHVDGLLAALARGEAGETYLFGGATELRNIDVVRAVCALLDELAPRGTPHERLIAHVTDRPGHDFRYAIDPTHARATLGWRPRHSFNLGLRRTVTWYLKQRDWVERAQSGAYRQERLGLPLQTTRPT